MTLPKTDFLSGEELTQVGADIVDLLGDTQISAAITYRRFTGNAFTPATGANTPSYTDTSLRAIRNAIPAREVAASEGLYKMKDLRFIIARAELSGEPTKDDRIVDGSDTYDLVDWDSDPVGVLWRIVARKVA